MSNVKAIFEENIVEIIEDLNAELLQDRIINFWKKVGAHLTLTELVDTYWGEVKSEFAVDLGVLYRNFLLKGLSFGANLSNMGPKITYVDAAQADPLPTNLKIGFAYKVLDMEYNKLTISLDTNKLLVVRHQDGTSDPFYKAIFSSWTEGSLREQTRRLITSCGAEYVYNNMIFLRAGMRSLLSLSSRA